MKFITRIEWANGTKEEFTFDSEWAQSMHTGKLWDNDLMDSVKWIDYDQV